MMYWCIESPLFSLLSQRQFHLSILHSEVVIRVWSSTHWTRLYFQREIIIGKKDWWDFMDDNNNQFEDFLCSSYKRLSLFKQSFIRQPSKCDSAVEIVDYHTHLTRRSFFFYKKSSRYCFWKDTRRILE